MARVTCVVIACLAATLPSAAAGAAALSPACKAVSTAMLKVVTTPHHAVSTRSGRPDVAELITIGDTNYLKYRGVWKKSPLSPADYSRQEEENIRNAKVYTCRQLPDESVDGTPAAVYSAHSETPDVGTADAKIWIAKSTGLPLRSDSDLNTGDEVQHTSTRYDYANIRAPVVK
jgi:hypothetical protein